MEDKKHDIKIELTPEIAAGHYANLAMIAHSAGEFYIDFINVSPNVPQARVQSRIILNPENAKNLLMALGDNIRKYEASFGEIIPKKPRNGGNGPISNGGLPNPFQA